MYYITNSIPAMPLLASTLWWVFLFMGGWYMRYIKHALTFEQQADLIISRGMIADRDILISRLQSVNYYRLSGYWHPFKTPDNKFKAGTTFDAVWLRYRFDRQLRIHIMDAVERVEVAIRTQLTNILAMKYGAFAHLNYANFPNITQTEHTLFIKRLKQDLSRSHEQFVAHFDSKYGNSHNVPPLWMIVELIPFGTTFTLFRAVDDDIKKAIADKYGVSDRVMESWLRAINSIRNACAHHSRLWNRQFGCKPLVPKKKKHPQWHDPVSPSADRIFIIMLILKHMMNTIVPQSEWSKRIECLLDKFNEIPVYYMGFPDNWQESPIWKGAENYE
jgi:abortive infection bacteriophage resistance protein